ncbi:uncharacterized protein LOC144007764 [Festucalex cinctus]
MLHVCSGVLKGSSRYLKGRRRPTHSNPEPESNLISKNTEVPPLPWHTPTPFAIGDRCGKPRRRPSGFSHPRDKAASELLAVEGSWWICTRGIKNQQMRVLVQLCPVVCVTTKVAVTSFKLPR